MARVMSPVRSRRRWVCEARGPPHCLVKAVFGTTENLECSARVVFSIPSGVVIDVVALRVHVLAGIALDSEDVPPTDAQEELPCMDISAPTEVQHMTHVTFDPVAGYLGLPDGMDPSTTPEHESIAK